MSTRPTPIERSLASVFWLTTALLALAVPVRAATPRSLAVSFSLQPDSTRTIELDRGSNDGVRIGDRGSISLPGFTAENEQVFAATDIPLIVEEVFADRAIARIPGNLPPLQPLSARITVLEMEPEDLGQRSPAPLSGANEPARAPRADEAIAADATEDSDIQVDETAVDETPAEAGWTPIQQVKLERAIVLPAETCTTNPAPCLNVTPADTLARAILAGRDPEAISARDAVGTMNVDDVDEFLREAISYYLRYPDRPKAALAIGQAYLHFQQPVQAEFWLANIEDDGSDPDFSDALTHARAYAAYQNGFYQEAIALSETFNAPTTDRQVLLAAAHLQRNDYARAADILDELPSLPEVINNRAIALQALDLELDVPCEVEQVGSMERCQENPLAAEQQRQARARTLLEAIAPKSATAKFNLAVLDIRANDFEAAHERMADVRSRANDLTNLADSAALALKQRTLWYANNYQENVAYLRSTAFPHSDFGYNSPTLGTFSQLLQAGLHPLALGNVVFLAVSDAKHDEQVKRVTAQLRGTFLQQLDFIPVVSPPDPLRINAYETFLESSGS